MNWYRCAGLVLHSEISLPLDEAGIAGDAVLVQREFGTLAVPEPLPYHAGGATYGPQGRGVLVQLGSGPRFLIEANAIRVYGNEAEAVLADLVVRVALGFVVQLRSLLSFHGAAVCRGGVALALLGFRGAGKSTTSLGLVHRGWSLLSDDLVVVGPDAVVPQGPCLTRLNEDSYRHLAGGLPPDKDSDGKWVVQPQRTGSEGRLEAIIVLEPGAADTVRVVDLRGQAKLSVLEHLHSPQGIGDPAGRWVQATRVLSGTRVFRIERPRGRFALDEVLDAVENLSFKEFV